MTTSNITLFILAMFVSCLVSLDDISQKYRHLSGGLKGASLEKAWGSPSSMREILGRRVFPGGKLNVFIR